MKKVVTVFVLFLMLFSVCTCSFATDAGTSPLQEVSTGEKVQVKAKVINVGKEYVKEEAEGVKRTLQDVTLQIKDRKIQRTKSRYCICNDLRYGQQNSR